LFFSLITNPAIFADAAGTTFRYLFWLRPVPFVFVPARRRPLLGAPMCRPVKWPQGRRFDAYFQIRPLNDDLGTLEPNEPIALPHVPVLPRPSGMIFWRPIACGLLDAQTARLVAGFFSGTGVAGRIWKYPRTAFLVERRPALRTASGCHPPEACQFGASQGP